MNLASIFKSFRKRTLPPSKNDLEWRHNLLIAELVAQSQRVTELSCQIGRLESVIEQKIDAHTLAVILRCPETRDNNKQIIEIMKPVIEKFDDTSVNELLLIMLKMRGYNNYENDDVSGESHFLKNVLPLVQPKTCIDVGANVGHYSEKILKYNENAVVYSFEPLNEPFSELKKVCARFEDRMIAVNQGVGNRCTHARIFFSDGRSAHASLVEEIRQIPYISNEKSQDITVTTLDQYFLEDIDVARVDFLKIDTEGYEYNVIQGASNLIKKFQPPLIQIEFNWHQLFQEKNLYSIARLLPTYQVYQLLSDRLVRRDPIDPLSNFYYFSNFVFVRKDLREILNL